MTSAITEGVKVSVETFYQQEYSNPAQNEFMFAYRVTIENLSARIIRLVSRKWNIYDSDFHNREVEGEGVVGMQPVIRPGEEYQYVSGCNLHTDIGKMHGVYTMEDMKTKEKFNVDIPSFNLITPFKNN